MASSSSAVATSAGYDVFINHRGPDVKKTFASHLYRRLRLHGLRTFLDMEELERNNLPSQIEQAIATASVHVAIFSPTYAQSRWCLDELVLMVKSGAVILPVFYHVKPSELRWTSGMYARDLQNLENKKTYDFQTGETKPRYDFGVIKEWRNTLFNVSNIIGFELHLYKGDEAELVDKVVEFVLKRVRKPSLHVAKYPTGLDEKVKDFEDFEIKVLWGKQNGKPQVVGIVGSGGVGKTTLAKEIFNRKRSSFSRSCFLSDVRETAGRNSLHSLLSKLLKDLTNLDIQVDSVTEGTELFKKHVSSNDGDNAIVILDDVDGVDQLNALLPVKNYLSSNSLILITSRDKDVLIRSGVEESSIYKLSGLSSQHSLELFCCHAFGQPHPLREFEDLVDEFVTFLNGLPLELKKYGDLLKLQDISFWESTLKKLERTNLIYDIEKAKYSCGLYRKVREWEKILSLQQQQRKEPQVVGVVGLGGKGKTTLAKEFFQRKSSYYIQACFLDDVGTSHLLPLLSKLLKGLTQLDHQGDSVEELTDLFKKPVHSLKSLVILDNVDHWDQLDALLSVLTVLPSDSLILITSRNKDVLERSGVEVSSIYELDGLNRQDALELFCLYAFSRRDPLPEFKDLVEEYLRACNGLPLTLKVFGALLCGKTQRSYWKDKLDRLQRSPNDIKKQLKISYDALTKEEQQLFLHIACCCIREKRDLMVRLWDGLGSRSLFESLQKRCLVEVDSEDCIIMHEHFRDLGRTIAEETGLRRPLWPPTENNPDLLQQSSNEQVITELRRNIDDLLQQSSVIREVRGFMILILIIMIIFLMMIMAMMNWSMRLGR